MSIDWRIEGMAVGVFGFGAREMSENAPESFDVTWRNGAYYVSVPNYQGGTVYSAEYVERLRSQLDTAKSLLREFLPAAVMDDAKKRAAAFLSEYLDADLPTAQDVRGILAQSDEIGK